MSYNIIKRLSFLLLTLLPLLGYGQLDPIRITSHAGAYRLVLSREALDRDIFLTTRVVALSGHKNIAAGQTFFPGMVLRFEQNGRLLLARKAGTGVQYDADSRIAPGIEANNLPAYAFVFEIAEQKDDRIEVDVTRFFSEEIVGVCPLPAGFKSGRFEPRLSGIVGFDNLPGRVNVTSKLVYTGVGEQFTAQVSYNLMLMDQPMRPREEDPRVGYMTLSRGVVREKEAICNLKYATRWRIEPRPEDRERYARGEKVEPERPIVFYLDPALPELVAKYAAQGILDWNEAFERIGFINAIRVENFPAERDFNRTDLLINALRYVPNTTANAMGATTVDPRSGEIIQGDIYWFHNVVDLIAKWRFVQTAASDPMARAAELPEEVMGPMIRYVAAHEMGHVLGLKHNMRGSYAYPVDSLRSPSFTARYGTTASIMDYARFNYVAQPGDAQRGVRLLPPLLGPYDYMAIQWGYGYPAGTVAGEELNRLLDEVFTAQRGNPGCLYSSSYATTVSPDPAAQSDMLGDDVVRSAQYGVDNLKFMVEHLAEWSADSPNPVDLMTVRYELIVKQLFKYLSNCASYAGGVYFVPGGSSGIAVQYRVVDQPKADQALRFIFAQLNDYSHWLARGDIFAVIGNRADLLVKEQSALLTALLKELAARIAANDGDLYGFFELLSDQVFARGTGSDLYSRTLQTEYISRLKALQASDDRLASAAASHALSTLEGRIKRLGGGSANHPYTTSLLLELKK